VVLSRRRGTVLLVALGVVVVTLGIMGVLRAVSASPNNEDNAHNNAKGRTLTVLTKTREAKVVDLGPQGPTHGDMRTVNAPLYDEGGKKRIGRLDAFCVLTDPADKPDEKAVMTECVYTYTLPDGEISGQGLVARPELSEVQVPGVDAVIGGTGKYVGVEGEVRHKTRGNAVIATFHFIG
jgi:allene oxide cyclase-like protein